MKHIYILILLLSFLISCSEDEIKPLVVTTADYLVTIKSDAIAGDVVGIVPGTSNRGTVTYSIMSQIPEGVFEIGETYGELIVNDTSFIEAGNKVSLQVNVSKEQVVKISTVEVSIIESCFSINLDSWVGEIQVEEQEDEIVMGIGIANDCGELILQGDVANFGCDFDAEVVAVLIPDDPNDLDFGTIYAERQPYSCLEDILYEFEAFGTYNSTNGIINMEYTFYENDMILYTGMLTISK